MSLGSFGTPHEVLDVDFDYFGTMVRVNPELSDLSLLEVLARIAAFDEETPPAAVMAAIDEVRATAIHPDDLETFRVVAKKNRQDLEDLVDLAEALVEAVTEVPTVQPSGSSDGLPSTEQSSVVVSSSPVVTRLEAKGRPDLALMVVQAQEHRSA